MRTTKSLSAAQYILSAVTRSGDGSVTPMQLIKLVYIAHGYMLGTHGKPLLDESVEAWQYGPVVRSVYDAVKKHRSSPVPCVDGADSDFHFSSDEKAIMDKVAAVYGKHDGIVLSSATHKQGTPWQLTWSANGKNASVSNDLIENFYSSLLKQGKHSAL